MISTTIILKPILVLKRIFISLSHNKLLNISIAFPYVVSQAILFAETLPPCVMLESGEHLEVNYEAFPQDVVRQVSLSFIDSFVLPGAWCIGCQQIAVQSMLVLIMF